MTEITFIEFLTIAGFMVLSFLVGIGFGIIIAWRLQR